MDRAIRMIVVVLAPVIRAVALIPFPDIKADLMASILSLVMGGRPRRVPCARERAIPALTRSTMSALSNSANTPSNWKRSRPEGVLVSRPCWCT